MALMQWGLLERFGNAQELVVDSVALYVENLQVVHVMVLCAGKLVLVQAMVLGACTLELVDRMFPLVYRLERADVQALGACKLVVV